MAKKFIQNDNNLAIAYYRFSSHSQNEASIDQQKELAHEWAEANGFNIVQEYEDAAISGTTEDRPGFQQMLYEVGKIRPNTLIMWKTDRLGRDRYVLAMAKKTIRDAGCGIHLLAENIQTETPEGAFMDGIMDAYAEFYSRQLSQNIQRGIDYNASHALYNGHKIFGYDVDKSTKKYIIDPDTAPFVERMFAEYLDGKTMKDIADDMNAQGLRTTRGKQFTTKSLTKMLSNRAYIGEYYYAGNTIPGGMPAIISEDIFEQAQAKKVANSHKQRRVAAKKEKTDDAPRFWLTGKLFCGQCGDSMHGVSGTSKTGRKYYYYNCKSQRGKACSMKKMRKENVEEMAYLVLKHTIEDTENLASIAVDAAAYYRDNYIQTHYLEGLEAKRKETERAAANLLKAIESGVISETITNRLIELEAQKVTLDEAIQAENIRLTLFEDEHSIKTYMKKFMDIEINSPETRDAVLSYFVDKIYLYEDKMVVTFFYSEDRTEISFDDMGGFVLCPFVKAEPKCSTSDASAPPKCIPVELSFYKNEFAVTYRFGEQDRA